MPSKEQVAGVTADLASRAQLPRHLSGVLAALPKDTHPMVQFSTAVLALQVRPRLAPTSPCSKSLPCHVQFCDACLFLCAQQPWSRLAWWCVFVFPRTATLAWPVGHSNALKFGCLGSPFSGSEVELFSDMGGARGQPASQFAAAYARGVPKTKYWEYAYEDSMDLIAKLPAVAAHIYRATYHGGKHIGHKQDLDWAANLSHMMGACLSLPCWFTQLASLQDQTEGS